MSSQTLQSPIAGRDTELNYLTDQLNLTLKGTGRLVLIAGEAGIGKTRLAEEFGKIAAQRGCRILTGRCLPGAAHPYLPFQEALGGLVAKETKGRSELGLPGWLHGPKATKLERDIREQPAQSWMASDSQDNPLSRVDAQALHSTLALLRATSAEQPLCLVLEDVHWIDSASLQLSHFLARNLAGLRVILLATYRPEDLSTREGHQTHPLVETIRTMRREDLCSELTVGPLGKNGLHTAIEGMLRGKLDQETLEKIWAESGGNPLFAIEVLRLLLETKSILFQDGVWKSKEFTTIDVPSTVREVILRRFERLSQHEKRIVECAATIGERFDPELVAIVLKLNKLRMLEALDSLEKDSRLLKTMGDVYQFSHEKIQRTVYEQMSSLRRRELHGVIGEVLEKQSAESRAGELSHHFALAGDRRKSLRYSLIAGQDALSRYAVPEARDYFNRALDAAKHDSPVLKERLQALEGLGDAAGLDGLSQPALESFENFLKLSTESTDRARVLRKCAQNAEGPKVLEYLQEAEKNSEVEPVEKARLEMIRVRLAVSSGRWIEAETLSSDTVRLFEQLNASTDLTSALLQQSFILTQEGRLREAREKLDEVSRRLEPSQDLVSELRLLDAKALIDLASGSVAEAIDAWGKMVTRESEFRLYRRQATTHWFRGFAYLTIDDFRSGRIEALRSIEFVVKSGLGQPWNIFPQFLLAHLDILENRIGEAERILEAVLPPGAIKGPHDSSSQFYASPYESGYVGYMLTVQASLLSAKRDWGPANEKWLGAIKQGRKGLWGLWTESLVRVHYAKYHLLPRELGAEAREQLKMAIDGYEQLGNTTHKQIAKQLLASIP